MTNITPEQLAEAERLNDMTQEVLSYNIQDGNAEDHIGAAEAQLAFYEASMRLQLALMSEQGIEFDSEGSLVIFRHTAEMHIDLAVAIGANHDH